MKYTHSVTSAAVCFKAIIQLLLVQCLLLLLLFVWVYDTYSDLSSLSIISLRRKELVLLNSSSCVDVDVLFSHTRLGFQMFLSI